MIFILFSMCFSFSIFATTFQLQTVDQQIAEADGVMMGYFLKQNSVRLENHSIATQMIFKINREYGLQSDQFGMDEVIIHYPGGKIGDQVTKVDGVPEFIPGEKVVLLIRSVENRFWGLNLALGAYKQVNYGKEIILVNSLVPNDRRVGQIRLDDFEKSVRSIKGSGLKVVSSPLPLDPSQVQERVPASIQQGKNRSIASKSYQAENEAGPPNLSIFWLVAVLAFLGGLFRFLNKKTSR